MSTLTRRDSNRPREHQWAGIQLLADYPGMVVGSLIVATFFIVSVFAPLPYDPLEPDTFRTLLPPSSTAWFGTDNLGMDLFSRVIAAARLDLPLAMTGALLAALFGVPLGLVASAQGRAADLIVRALDIFQSFPLLVVSMGIVALAGNNIQAVVVAILMVNTPRFIRLVRSEALGVRASRYVEAAIAIGASSARVTFVHVLPNVTATIFAQLSITVGGALLTIASLSFIGVGIVPPTPSWGAMIRMGTPFVVTGQWWLALFPGIAVVLFVMSFNAIAEGIDARLGSSD